ncbi:hypothetical protein Tco_0226801 [Tanacetum coccineum]
MFVFFVNALLQNTMAEQNVPAQPPTRTNEQIVLASVVTIGNKQPTFNAKDPNDPTFEISGLLRHSILARPVLTGKTSGSDKQGDTQFLQIAGNSHSNQVISTTWQSITTSIGRPSDSAVHHTGDDYVLGNLKFVPKGESVEVFGMAIPDPRITEAIQQSSYYPKYLKMVAENTKKTTQGSASVQPATQRATPKKPTQHPHTIKQNQAISSSTKKLSKPKMMGSDLELAKKFEFATTSRKEEIGGGDELTWNGLSKLSLDRLSATKDGHLLEE